MAHREAAPNQNPGADPGLDIILDQLYPVSDDFAQANPDDIRTAQVHVIDYNKPTGSPASRVRTNLETSRAHATPAAPNEVAVGANVVGWEPIKKDPEAEAVRAKMHKELTEIARVIATVPKLPEQRPATSMEPFSFQRPTERKQVSYPNDRPLRQRFLQRGSAESGNQALARSSEIGGADEPKVTLAVGALQQLGYSEGTGYTKNEDRIEVGRSTFVVCDGMGGETTRKSDKKPGDTIEAPHGPAIAAQVGAETILRGLEGRGVHYKIDDDALNHVKDVFARASWAIEEHGGTGTTASVIKVLYVDGKPKLALGAAGDSRIFVDPMPEEANRGTRRYIDEQVYRMRSYSNRDFMQKADQERAERLAFDGGLPYEWTVDELGHGTSTYIGAAGPDCENAATKDGDITMRLGLLDLEPGRTRVMICSDGITGDGARQLISADAFKHAFDQRNPLDAADAFMKASKKGDDKSIIVVDIYVDEAGVAHIEPAAEPEASDAARVAQWDADIVGASAESLEPSESAEPAVLEMPEIASAPHSPDTKSDAVADNPLAPQVEPAPLDPIVAQPEPSLSAATEAPAPLKGELPSADAGRTAPDAQAAPELPAGMPLMSRFDALTYDQWKDRLPLGDNGEPLSYRDWISMGIGQRQAYLERQGLWDKDTLQKMTAERAGIDYTLAPYSSRSSRSLPLRTPAEPEPLQIPADAEMLFDPPRTAITPRTQTSGAGLPPVPPEAPQPPADANDIFDDGWDFDYSGVLPSDAPKGTAGNEAPTSAQPIARNANPNNGDGSLVPPFNPGSPNVPSSQPPSNPSQPPVAPPNIPSNPNRNTAPNTNRRTRKLGAAAALATVAALGTYELAQTHDSTAERPGRTESSIPSGGPAESGSTAPATQHQGNIDFQITDTNGRVSRVTTELHDHGAGQHGAPWDAARTALESIGIARPSEAQIADLTNSTLAKLNISPAAARRLPDGYKLTYDVVDGKLVPRARS